MINLAFDTSNGLCVVGLYLNSLKEPAILDYLVSAEINQQTHWLMDYINQLLTKYNTSIQELDNIIVTSGPGSFTGVRIGISAGLGFKLAMPVPIYTINSLAAMALDYKLTMTNEGDILVLWQTTMQDIYYQSFSASLQILTPPQVMTLDSCDIQALAHKYIIIGNLMANSATMIEKYLTYKISYINMANIAAAFEQQIYAHLFSDSLEPIYLRPAISL